MTETKLKPVSRTGENAGEKLTIIIIIIVIIIIIIITIINLFYGEKT